ncbi:MAG: uracil-DNA glycosylase [Burkholderiaceae bacterium]|nr:uracil-DNA glycosylase [Burkholderiaceae bacterium]
MQIPDLPPPAIPRLSHRHRAMLLEMGVPVWWPDPQAASTLPPVEAPVSQAPTARTETRSALPPQRSVTPPPARVTSAPARVQQTRPHDAALDAWPHLEALQAAIQACTRCGLAQGRQRAVPGMGDSQPDWLIVGEAPGEEEDRQGLPFVGRAGQLLDRMLAAMQLTRTQKVYIANVLKCRPPMNRNPDPVEMAACSPYLLRQIQLLRPKMVLAMGRFAAQTLLSEGGALSADQARQLPLGKLRGRIHQVTLGGLALPVVVTYHPAYLLRSPAEKAKAWADLCLAMDAMDNFHRH